MMLRLWSQVARPQLSCNCVACSNSITGVLARRTASATTRRRLKLVDAFTILLAPVLATAFIADVSWKDRRRIEWDKRIAEVEGEVERLHGQESQILGSLKRGGNARSQWSRQIRLYSTDVRSRVLEDDTAEDVHARQWRWTKSEVKETDNGYQISARDAQEVLPTNSQVTEDDRNAMRRIEKLVALKFALRMVVHVNVGTSPRFKDANPGYSHDSRKPPGDFNHLMNQLKIVRRSLRHLNAASQRPNVSAFQKLPRNEQAAVDLEICQAVHEFQLGRLSVREVVMRIGNSIIRASEPPSVNAYVPLMTAFSRSRLDELAYLVMAAMEEGRLTISESNLSKIIWQYGKNRDARRFDLFLKSVTKADAESRYKEPWEWKVMNGVELPCPESQDSRLLQILIYTALKCDQPHRAQAWASLLNNSDSHAKCTSHVLRNFMKFYSTHRDWLRGQAWLSAALGWSVSQGPNVIRDLQRVVFAILELCVACGKQEAYSCILKAAVHAKVGVFRAEPDLKFTVRSKSILAEWEREHNSQPTCAEDDRMMARSIAGDFYAEVTPKLEALGVTNSSPRFEWPTPKSANLEFPSESSDHSISTNESATGWRELYKRQAAELEKLKAQLAESKWLLSSTAKSVMEDHDSQTSYKSPASAKTSEPPVPSPSVNLAPSRLADYSIALAHQEQIPSPSSKIAPRISSEVGQETENASPHPDSPVSDLEQAWTETFAPVADFRSRESQSLKPEDLVNASASNKSLFNDNSTLASVQGSSKHENNAKSIHADFSSYLCRGLPADSVQSNTCSKFRPFAGEKAHLDGEIERFQKQDAKDSQLSESIRFTKESPEPPAPTPDVAMHGLDRRATYERKMHTVAPDAANAVDVPNSAAELQPREPSTHIRKVSVSFQNMPRTRTLSARATLRFILPTVPRISKVYLSSDSSRKASSTKIGSILLP